MHIDRIALFTLAIACFGKNNVSFEVIVVDLSESGAGKGKNGKERGAHS